jgi:hypothetical protein
VVVVYKWRSSRCWVLKGVFEAGFVKLGCGEWGSGVMWECGMREGEREEVEFCGMERRAGKVQGEE